MSADGSPRSLTAREAQVLTFADAGLKPKQIALKLGTAPSTIRVQMMTGRRKLADGADPKGPECVGPECGRLLRGHQQRFCSDRCKFRDFRVRHGHAVGPLELAAPIKEYLRAFDWYLRAPAGHITETVARELMTIYLRRFVPAATLADRDRRADLREHREMKTRRRHLGAVAPALRQAA